MISFYLRFTSVYVASFLFSTLYSCFEVQINIYNIIILKFPLMFVWFYFVYIILAIKSFIRGNENQLIQSEECQLTSGIQLELYNCHNIFFLL